MKILGILICLFGTIGAILFVPCQFLGTNVGWHFILEDEGSGLHAYNFINTTAWFLQLIGVNAIGLTMFFLGRREAR